MDDGTSSSNPFPISQPAAYDEPPALSPEASFASVNDPPVDEHVDEHGEASQLLKGKRKLSTLHQHFIVGLSKANTGPVKGHKIAKQLYGDYANVGAQEVEFRNFHRDVVQYIGKHDAQMVGYSTCRLQEFRSIMKSLVYDYHIETKDFEDKWSQLMAEYEMSGNKWLSKMFRLREFWIPAYFRDIPLGGLLRTTSRSESMNSFFGTFLNKDLTLVAFFLNFNSALESQRQTKCKCDTENQTKKSVKKTPLSIEVDALNHYTRKLFQDVQTEICASCFHVSIINVLEHENITTHEIQDPRLFERVGILCRHVFAALKYAGIGKILAKYVLNRWTKTAIETASQGADPCLVEDCQTIEQPVVAEQELWTEFNACVNLAANDTLKTKYIHHKLKEIRVHFEEVSAGESVCCKSIIIGELIGASKPTELLVKPPAVVHTKGSGKCLESEFEKAINKPERAPRMCKFCLTLGNHDSRNCPLKEQLNDPK
ncbi:hypothetical protein QQ045_004045 [Rhodiola kirilowii]